MYFSEKISEIKSDRCHICCKKGFFAKQCQLAKRGQISCDKFPGHGSFSDRRCLSQTYH
ncbi:hypothetical protein CDL12_07178 [Handroanthus impetiginosus]|uniref:Uncharacterized protein n=1 Tax=Handroanthus impetiginosus TaxID=429701 RepID=A0A2G9HRH7_9LAMI|nr:hypothetical protein CDL12_07178 [Handroanthus impetiginosus]